MASPESLGSPLAGELTRAQAKDALRRIQMSLETLQRQIDESVAQIGEIPRRELHTFLARQRDACQRWNGEQHAEWAALLGEDEEAEDSQDSRVRDGMCFWCDLPRENGQEWLFFCCRVLDGLWGRAGPFFSPRFAFWAICPTAHGCLEHGMHVEGWSWARPGLQTAGQPRTLRGMPGSCTASFAVGTPPNL